MIESQPDLKLAEYTILNTINRSQRSVVYLARQNKSDQKVVVKTPHPMFLPTRKEFSISYEYQILDHLHQSGWGDSVVLDQSGIYPALIMSNAGVNLRQIIDDGLSFGFFLKMALQISSFLGKIHKAKIVHQDINPENILWNSDTEHVSIIDFGIASTLSGDKITENTARVPYESLPYISPEMTGRMNRATDYRTDYYSLGITFYELLTGKTPFQAEDTMKWVYCHIAKRPNPPSKIRGSVPAILDALILKLISKDPEDRYQSTYGLISDLARIKEQWDYSQSCESFTLGRQDRPETFRISQKLYGREIEKAILINIFEEVATGSSELSLIDGFSGIGKSTLVNEIQQHVILRNGFFISGKSNQSEQTTPFYAIAQAFQKLVRHLLADTEESIAPWKNQFQNALGSNGKVILDIIPDMSSIIGEQPPIPILNPEEAQNRFVFTFRDFLKVFSDNSTPLVVFLDDLQWSDSASLEFIKTMATDKDIKFLFIIGAYRNNEVDIHHPFICA